MRKLFIAVSIAFFLVSCDTGHMDNETGKPNPFIGTWEVGITSPENSTAPEMITSLKFTDTDVTHVFQYQSHDKTIREIQSAAYTYDNEKIYFTITKENGDQENKETTYSFLDLPQNQTGLFTRGLRDFESPYPHVKVSQSRVGNM